MTTADDERSVEQQRFVANVSHELRTPLTALTAAAEILAAHRAELPQDAADAADLVVDLTERMVRLVHDLLELSEIGSGTAPIRWEPVDLRALVDAVLARRGRRMPVDGDATTYADKARLERILGNLVDNAFEHADGHGARAAIRVDDGWVSVAVRDRGPGVHPDDIPHLFDSFFKADRSRTGRRGGIGMGLPIAFENAQLLGGSIDVDSTLGEGTTMTLRLPSRTAAPTTTGSRRRSRSAGPAPRPEAG